MLGFGSPSDIEAFHKMIQQIMRAAKNKIDMRNKEVLLYVRNIIHVYQNLPQMWIPQYHYLCSPKVTRVKVTMTAAVVKNTPLDNKG